MAFDVDISPAALMRERQGRRRGIIWFAGGGGTSQAYKTVFGQDPDVALNHWWTAVEAHRRHHPATAHFCADAFEIDPHKVLTGERIGFGWFSPDCTHFSRAKGKALRSERRRGLAWVVVDWAAKRCLDVIIVENVWEFTGWGPLYPEGHPQAGERIPEREGETFRHWVGTLEWLGYRVEWRKVNCADYGDPTTRERLIVIARRDGKPIVWPAPTHAPRAKAAALGLKPWVGAHTIIDWSLPCHSIFMTPAEIKARGLRIKRPLVAATLKRVARGLQRYVLESAEPFIAPVTHQGDSRVRPVGEPLPTVTGAHRGELTLTVPAIVGCGGRRGQSPPCDVTRPMPTITGKPDGWIMAGVLAPITNRTWGPTRAMDVANPLPTITTAKGGEFALAVPYLVRADMHSAASRNGIRGLGEPLATVTGNGGFAVVTAFLTKFRAGAVGCDLREPAPTITANGYQKRPGGAVPIGVVSGWLIPHHGERDGQAARSRELTAPYPTVTGSNRGGDLVVAHLDRQHGSSISGRDFAQPLATNAAQGYGGHSAVVASYLSSYYGTDGTGGSSLSEPMRSVTGLQRHAQVAAWLEQANTGLVGHDAREPASTIVLKGSTQRLVEALLVDEGGPAGRRSDVLAFLWAHFGEPTTEEWLDPWATARGRLRFGYVEIKGARYRVADIGLRMLKPRELLGAMGMPPGFDLERTAADERGIEHPISITNQTHMTGNMVPHHMAAAHMAANAPGVVSEQQGRAA